MTGGPISSSLLTSSGAAVVSNASSLLTGPPPGVLGNNAFGLAASIPSLINQLDPSSVAAFNSLTSHLSQSLILSDDQMHLQMQMQNQLLLQQQQQQLAQQLQQQQLAMHQQLQQQQHHQLQFASSQSQSRLVSDYDMFS